ncbi:MAG: hypothetical protein ACKPKO_50200, partial [Candidatus Fonsibacter sp.]
MIGIEGGKDVLVMKAAYSGLKAAYPMPDKTADSTMMAVQHFKGNREISRFFFRPLRRDRTCSSGFTHHVRHQ